MYRFVGSKIQKICNIPHKPDEQYNSFVFDDQFYVNTDSQSFILLGDQLVTQKKLTGLGYYNFLSNLIHVKFGLVSKVNLNGTTQLICTLPPAINQLSFCGGGVLLFYGQSSCCIVDMINFTHTY